MTSLKDPHERWTEGYVLHHLFFGVDSAISTFEDWVASMFHTGSNQSNDNILVHLPSIWTTASDTGMKISVPDLNIYHMTFFIIPI